MMLNFLERVDQYWDDVRRIAEDSLRAVADVTGHKIEDINITAHKADLVQVIDDYLEKTCWLTDADLVIVVLGGTDNVNAYANEITTLEEDCNTLPKLLNRVAYYAMYYDVRQAVLTAKIRHIRSAFSAVLKDAGWKYDDDKDVWTSPRGTWEGDVYDAHEVFRAGCAYDDCLPCLGAGCFRCNGTGSLRVQL